MSADDKPVHLVITDKEFFSLQLLINKYKNIQVRLYGGWWGLGTDLEKTNSMNSVELKKKFPSKFVSFSSQIWILERAN